MVVIGDMGERDIKMKRTPEELDDIIDKVKRNDIVCDSINRCKGWQKSYRSIYEAFLSSKHQILPFKYCPYCGKDIRSKP